MPRLVVRALIVWVAASLAAGCATAPASQSVPNIGAIPTVDTTSQIVLPIDAYVPSVGQIEKLTAAADILQAQCMDRFGVPYTPWSISNLDEVPVELKSRNPLYGYFTGTSTDKGYDRGSDDSVATASANQPTSSPDALAVFYGMDASGKKVTAFQGKSVPSGGCAQSGLQIIGGEPVPPSASELPDGGPQTPATDLRLTDAYSKWSTCMKGKGFNYTTPMAAYLDPRWAPTSTSEAENYVHSPNELATAGADLACKKETNLMGIVVAVEAAYDNQYINSHGPALSEYRQQFSDWLTRASQIIAAGRSGF